MGKYLKYDLKKDAALAFNFLTRMNDEKFDYLPYWLVSYDKYPAWAKHCRVDDSELVASWLDGLMCCQEILETDDGAKIEQAYKRHLLKSWGPKGLRYHEKYPWTQTVHSQFHEMAYVLSALNRWQEQEPENIEVQQVATSLVQGMRDLAIERKRKTFWSGDLPLTEKIYEWPNDVYLWDKGWGDFECMTGRGEFPIRNGIVLHPLVRRWQLFGDDVALDLAVGLANWILGPSRYFNWKGEYFGHVHSTVWVVQGLVLLGKLTGEKRYLKRGKEVYDYTIKLSSSFGWVPEYGQWNPEHKEVCETCCIRDMIECGIELIDAGYAEYYDLVNRFVRNQLSEQQIKEAPFVHCDNSREDTEEYTFKDIDQRVVGGFSGGAGPHSINTAKFRSVAGCCVGTAPQAMYAAWKKIVTKKENFTYINFPIDREHSDVIVGTKYPDSGEFSILIKTPGDYRVRIYDFMKTPDFIITLNDTPVSFDSDNAILTLKGLVADDKILIKHDIDDVISSERVMGQPLEVHWRGCDVVDITPHGAPLRLYQRKLTEKKEFPAMPAKVEDAGIQEIMAIPTEPLSYSDINDASSNDTGTEK